MRTSIALLASLLVVASCSFLDNLVAKHTSLISGAHQTLRERSISEANSFTCWVGTCVGIGGNCSTIIDNNYNIISSPVCINGGTCPTQEPKLCYAATSAPLPTHGQSCTTNSGCATADLQCTYSFVNGYICAYYNEPRGAGTSCSSDTDCQFANSLHSCSSGKCQGADVGQSCTSSNDCNGFAYCSSGLVCTDYKQNGQACNTSADCYGNCINSVCGNPGSVSSGGACSDDSDCADNLYCNSNAVCASAPSSSGRACNFTTDCDSSESCYCNYNNGASTCSSSVITNPSGTASAEQNLNNCALNNNAWDAYTGFSKCRSQFCAVISISANQLEALFGRSVPSCAVSSIREQFFGEFDVICPKSSGASSIIVSVGALAVLIIGLLL